MNAYTTKQRIFFGICGVLCMVVAAVLIVQVPTSEPEDVLESLLVAAGSCALALVAAKIVVTGTSWHWFERPHAGRGACARWRSPRSLSASR